VNGVVNKWRIKAGKTMFVLKTTVEEELLEHIRDKATPKEAWDALVAIFSKENDAKLQLLENELLFIKLEEVRVLRGVKDLGGTSQNVGVVRENTDWLGNGGRVRCLSSMKTLKCWKQVLRGSIDC
jgi:hypothetical protein